MRYRTFHEKLTNAVLATPGATPESLRRAVLEHARQSRPSQDVPPPLSGYVDTVTRHAYKVGCRCRRAQAIGKLRRRAVRGYGRGSRGRRAAPPGPGDGGAPR